jgi:hypothetical protein
MAAEQTAAPASGSHPAGPDRQPLQARAVAGLLPCVPQQAHAGMSGQLADGLAAGSLAAVPYLMHDA